MECMYLQITASVVSTLTFCRFRWVQCQLDSLRICRTTSAVRKTLAEFPKALADTYDRILENTIQNTANGFWTELHSILSLLTVSFRPLTVNEAAETLVVDCENCTFESENRLDDPYDLLEICSSLVTLSTYLLQFNETIF